MSESGIDRRPGEARRTRRYGKQPVSPIELLTGSLGLVLLLAYVSRSLDGPPRFFMLVGVMVLAAAFLTDSTNFVRGTEPAGVATRPRSPGLARAGEQPVVGSCCLVPSGPDGFRAEIRPGDFCAYPAPAE